jgi:hypothetical protein
MAGVMVVCYVVAHVSMPRDKPAETVSSSA